MHVYAMYGQVHVFRKVLNVKVGFESYLGLMERLLQM